MRRTSSSAGVFALVLSVMMGCTTNETGGMDPGGSVDLAVPGPPPLITEFLAKNQSGLTDEDGSTSDWIEIHNPDVVPLDLGGYHLTDSKTNPKRWAFPDGAIVPAGGYLVVFASGKNRAVAGKPLHTDFSLSGGDPGGSCSNKGGEYLALTNKNGGTLAPAWEPYPAQSSDVSYGLSAPTAPTSALYFAIPTPGAPNILASALAERVTFNPPSRTFNSGTTIQVSLGVTSPTASIRYTTNRSRPIATAGRIGVFSANATSDVCALTAHGLSTGDLVRVSGPAPLVPTVNYFVKVLSSDTFKLSIEPGGPTIDLTAGGSFEVRRDAVTGNAATTDIITTTAVHTFNNGDAVQVSSAGALPAGLTTGTTYYVVVGSSTAFRLSTSPTLNPIVDITSVGTGPQTVFRIPSPLYATPIPVAVNARIRARASEPGRPDGPLGGEMYFALDAAAQTFTSNLPLIVTHTWNLAMPNDAPVDGQIMLFEPKPPDNLARMTNLPDLVAPCSLERHGSSTANEIKFSMALELQDENGIDQSCSPLGMPSHSDWIINAPYRYDRSMIHNDLIYRISNDVGRYAPRTRLAEHFHNEQSLADTIEGAPLGTDYFGVYCFMEKITRGANRVNVDNLSIGDTTPPTISGGYLFKADRLDAGELGIRPLTGQSFGGAGVGGALAWVNPRELSVDPFKVVNTAQSNWLRGYIGDSYASTIAANASDPVNGYAKYFDVASVIDHHILNVATKNPDAFALSSYWHKPRNGKITAGPIWDFDRAEGSTDGRDFDWGTWPGSTGRDLFAYPWYKEMFVDPNFWQAWIDRLHQLRQGALATPTLMTRIDEFVAQLNPGNAPMTPAKRSIARWPVSAPRTSASNTAITNNLFDGTYPGEVAWLKYWWTGRLNFMDRAFTRPAVASLPPGKVPAGTTITLSSPSQSIVGVKIYYTTDGTDPRPPAPGPTLSPSAIEYTGPIRITGATTLFVRTWNPATPSAPSVGTVPVGSRWSAPTILSYSL